MIRIAKNDFGAKLLERLLRQSLDGSRRAHGHEHRRLDRAMRRGQPPYPRPARVSLLYFKRKTHPVSLSRENPRQHGEEQNDGDKNGEDDRQGLTYGQFFGIRRGKPN